MRDAAGSEMAVEDFPNEATKAPAIDRPKTPTLSPQQGRKQYYLPRFRRAHIARFAFRSVIFLQGVRLHRNAACVLMRGQVFETKKLPFAAFVDEDGIEPDVVMDELCVLRYEFDGILK